MNFWNWFFRRKAREEDLQEEVQTHLRLAAQVHSDQAVAELTTSPMEHIFRHARWGLE